MNFAPGSRICAHAAKDNAVEEELLEDCLAVHDHALTSLFGAFRVTALALAERAGAQGMDHGKTRSRPQWPEP